MAVQKQDFVIFDAQARTLAVDRASGEGALQAAYLLARLVGILDGLRPDSPDLFMPLKGMTQDAVDRVFLAVEDGSSPSGKRNATQIADHPVSVHGYGVETTSDAVSLRIAILQGVNEAAFFSRIQRLRRKMMAAIEFCLIDSQETPVPV